MGKKVPWMEVDPLSLPLGMEIGAWRIRGWRGRGAYGTLYRVEREDREEEGSFALKLAISPGDERFEREAALLSRIQSPHVPRFEEQGLWEHPSGAFPYVVMQWVEGEPLYEWASRRNPTSRQVLKLLAQVARALEATHAASAVHRDVKGANVLVRPADGRVFLTDFGAGHYRGAVTLTSKVLPPGTPAYRSPEAWGFLRLFLRHPSAHYPASASDDLFALGVMAYRLVTDEYPSSSQPERGWAEVWREGAPGPRPPRELNPHVTEELEAVILKLLSVAPVERFQGRAREAAEALEQAARGTRPAADVPLFTWGHEHHPRWRSRGGVRLARERDAAAKKELARREQEQWVRAEVASLRGASNVRVRVWGAEGVVAVLGLLFAWLTVELLHREQEAVQRSFGEGGVVALGDSAGTSGSPSASQRTNDARPVVGLPMPETPLPGQLKPPCKRFGEVEIRGGCWFEVARAKPPCKEEGKEDGYAWKGVCYAPSYPVGRQPTAGSP